jgi:hypothetical protein
MVSSAEKSDLVVEDGGNIWVLKSTGSRSADLLLQVASTVRFSTAANHSQQGF